MNAGREQLVVEHQPYLSAFITILKNAFGKHYLICTNWVSTGSNVMRKQSFFSVHTIYNLSYRFLGLLRTSCCSTAFPQGKGLFSTQLEQAATTFPVGSHLELKSGFSWGKEWGKRKRKTAQIWTRKMWACA